MKKTTKLANAFCGPYILDALIESRPPFEYLRAHHSENHKQVYVAKVLRQQSKDDKTLVDHLRFEYETLNGIDYAGFPKVYRHGTVKDQPCMISQWIEGTTLTQLAEENPDFNRLAAYLSLVKLVGVLHQQGIVHNRLSLDSFKFNSQNGRLYITGFSGLVPANKGGFLTGLLRKKKQPLDLRHLDQAYIAPEILEGGQPSQKTDLYALGQCGYALFGLQEGDENEARRHSSSSGQQRTVSRGTSTRRLQAMRREYRGQTPKGLQDLIESCLRSNPDFRPESVDALFEELKGFYQR